MLALAILLQISNPAPAPSASVTDATARAEAQAARQAAQAAQATAAARATPADVQAAVSAVQAAMPTASTTVPPGVTDSGAAGTMTMVYALANHTHASRARKITATSAANGTYTWTFGTPFTAPPICTAVAEVAAGVTDVVNVQIVGTPTVNSVTMLVNRANRSVASLLGLTVLSVPASPGATKLHAICLEG